MTTDYTDTQLEMLDRRWRKDASPHLSLQLADVYRQRGQLAAALPVLERGLEAHPGHVSVQVALGRYRLEAGDPEGAATVLREVVDRDAGHLVANKLLVRAYLALGDRKRAADRLELYAVLNDNDPELETLRATVGGELPVEAARLAPPPLPDAVTAAGSPSSADLAAVARPRRRGLTGTLGRAPFSQLIAEPLVPAPLPTFFRLDEAEVEAAPSQPPVRESETAPAAAEPEVEPVPSESAEEEVEPVPSESAEEEVEPVPSESAAEEPEPVPSESVAEEPLEGTEIALDEPPSRAHEELPRRSEPEEVDAGSAATSTLGALYLAQGHVEDARRTFERVLERDPDDAEAQAGLAEAASRLSDGETAPEPAGRSVQSATIAHLQDYLDRIRRAADRMSV